jgi:hypothetical protein
MSEKPPSTNKKTARRRTLCSADRGCGSGYAQSRSLVAAAIGHEANASKAKDHHRPGGGLGNCLEEATDFAARKRGAVNIEVGPDQAGFVEPPGDSKANALQHPILATRQPSGFVFRGGRCRTAFRAKTHQRRSWSHRRAAGRFFGNGIGPAIAGSSVPAEAAS